MNKSYASVHVVMRMSIGNRWNTVSCPSCMSYSHSSSKDLVSNYLLEIGDSSYRLSYLDLTVTDNCDSGRVIASVFELLKSVNQKLLSITASDKTYYSAHKPLYSLSYTYLSVTVFCRDQICNALCIASDLINILALKHYPDKRLCTGRSDEHPSSALNLCLNLSNS